MSEPAGSSPLLPPVRRYSVRQLRCRGWSAAMIRDLLGPPDETVPNPRVAGAAPMVYYAAHRVESVERGPIFAARARQAARRAEAARAAVERQRSATLDLIRRRPITLPALEREQLARRAIEHHNEALIRKGTPIRRCPSPNHPEDIDPQQLRQWEVAYLRTVLTPYDALLAALSGRVGRVEGELLVRRRVYTAIAVRYPHLARECDRLLAERVRIDAPV
ncbi:hypothetical protein RIF23_01885 [Lipingzhangella sp. LS1_29]|uniref:DUF2293 domain-containing protein n=1 Tax=Lipingzhangella rawalii TaxID=2055835 RepID=A0ABU2H2F3_9ACTN|nr:hypothetical protein [Lipingzhangella rawalii]MDS1269040.1 hypothetical protein [Lipingzhangella rawalii]